MILRVVTGISNVLIFVVWVVTVTSTVSVLGVVIVVVYRSVTVVVETFSGRVFTSKLEDAETMRRIRSGWVMS
jgi:hypothetical protein